MSAIAIRGRNIVSSYADYTLVDEWQVLPPESKKEHTIETLKLATDLRYYVLHITTRPPEKNGIPQGESYEFA